MALHFNVHVDATDYPGYLARYVNDNLDDDGARRNARFVKDPERRLATFHDPSRSAGRRTVRRVRRGILATPLPRRRRGGGRGTADGRVRLGEDSGDGAAVRLRGDR